MKRTLKTAAMLLALLMLMSTMTSCGLFIEDGNFVGIGNILDLASGGNGTLMETDSYKVSTNMMKYYYTEQYNNFYSAYGSYLGSHGALFSLDPSLPLDEQPFGGAEGSTNYDKVFLGEFTGTWHDYFVDLTVKYVREMLLYCEASSEFDVFLTEKDYAEIDEELIDLVVTANNYGYPSLDSFLSATYGKGVSENDVKSCLEFSTLSEKTMQAIADKLRSEIRLDRIEAEYNADRSKYDVVDLISYTFRLKGYDVNDSYYEQQLAQLNERADRLSSLTTLDEFVAVIAEYEGRNIEDIDVDDFMSLKNSKSELAPDIAEWAFNVETGSTTRVAESNGETYSLTVYMLVRAPYAYLTESASFFVYSDAKVAAAAIEALSNTEPSYDNMMSVVQKYVPDNIFHDDSCLYGEYDSLLPSYTVNDKLGIYVNENYNGSFSIVDGNAVTDKYVSSDVNGSVIYKPNSDGSLSAGSGYTAVYNTSIDEWLYDSERVLGDVTEEPINAGSSKYLVIYHRGEGEYSWYEQIRDSIAGEAIIDNIQVMEKNYHVTTHGDISDALSEDKSFFSGFSDFSFNLGELFDF